MNHPETAAISRRRPRFRRAENTPNFRVTEDDVTIIRHIAQHRFLRSTHIAQLVSRSLDRTNDRLCHLFHAGYVDRPRAQLDYYPSGSAPMVYALANRGARLLAAHHLEVNKHFELSRKNGRAGRPFIEHQIEIAEFSVAIQLAARHSGLEFVSSEDIAAGAPDKTKFSRHPFWVNAKIMHRGARFEIGLVPDLVFGLRSADGSIRNFVVEIDRGTMPITRAEISQTSIARKLQCYLSAHATKSFEKKFAWKNYRVLFVTTDEIRVRSMIDALHDIQSPTTSGSSLFLFCGKETVLNSDVKSEISFRPSWRDADGRLRSLV